VVVKVLHHVTAWPNAFYDEAVRRWPSSGRDRSSKAEKRLGLALAAFEFVVAVVSRLLLEARLS